MLSWTQYPQPTVYLQHLGLRTETDRRITVHYITVEFLIAFIIIFINLKNDNAHIPSK